MCLIRMKLTITNPLERTPPSRKNSHILQNNQSLMKSPPINICAYSSYVYRVLSYFCSYIYLIFVLTYIRARMNTNGFLILPQWPTPLLIDKYGIQGFQMTLLIPLIMTGYRKLVPLKDLQSFEELHNQSLAPLHIQLLYQ